MRILAVDDEPSILELLAVYLEAEGGHEVVTAASGLEALAAIDAAEHGFDCFLLDIQMPEMNGIALCENIRALTDYYHVPIIMLTAMSQRTYIDKAFSVGATDYVTKPFDFLELTGRLKAAAKISYEYNRACDVADTAMRMINDLGGEAKPHLAEPLPIEGVERVVSYAAFDNFVLTLSGTKLLFTSVFAVKIVDFDVLHDTATSRELLEILNVVAQVITEQIPDLGSLVSYRGNGIFLCINQRKDKAAVNHMIIDLGAAPSHGTQSKLGVPEIQVIFGQKISLVSLSKTGALATLKKAIELIERQPVPVREVAELTRRVLPNQPRTLEQSKLDRRAYDVFLEEIIREEERVVP